MRNEIFFLKKATDKHRLVKSSRRLFLERILSEAGFDIVCRTLETPNEHYVPRVLIAQRPTNHLQSVTDYYLMPDVRRAFEMNVHNPKNLKLFHGHKTVEVAQGETHYFLSCQNKGIKLLTDTFQDNRQIEYRFLFNAASCICPDFEQYFKK